MTLAERLTAAANGDVPWRKALLLEAASAMSAFGQDAEERLEAEPASAVPKADAQ